MPRPRTDIQPRLVKAARARFLADGVDGASVRAIARDAKTSLGMVTYYFPSKDELFLAVVEEHYGPLVEDLERALDPAVPVAARVERLFTRIGAMSPDEQVTMRLLVRELFTSSTRREKILPRFLRGHIGLILKLATDGAGDGTFAALPPALIALATVGVGFFPQLVVKTVGPAAAGAIGLPAETDLPRLLAEVLLRGVSNRH